MHYCPFGPLFCLLKLSAHLLLSYLLVWMAPAESVEVQLMENFYKGSLLNIYATREKNVWTVPDIMLLNFTDFASKYKMVNKKLTYQSDNILPRVFPVILDCHSAKWSIVSSNQTKWVIVLGGHCVKWSIVVSNQAKWIAGLGGHSAKWSFVVSNQASLTSK